MFFQESALQRASQPRAPTATGRSDPPIRFMAPSTRYLIPPILGDDRIPEVPIRTPKQLMRATAEPVSSSCCSSIRLAPRVLMQLPIIVAGKRQAANIQGSWLPKRYSSRPSCRYGGKPALDDGAAGEPGSQTRSKGVSPTFALLLYPLVSQ